MKKLLYFMILFPLLSFAQDGDKDLRQYNQGFSFAEGLYLTMEDFKENKPVFRQDFERSGSQLLLYDDSLKKKIVVEPKKIWGYSQVDNIYIAYEDAYWRLISIGRLSHFSAIFISTFQTVDAYGFPVERNSKSMEHLFLDFKTGKVKRLNYDNLETYFKEEPMQYDAFKKLKKKKQRDLILALRAYNELHPIYFPESE